MVVFKQDYALLVIVQYRDRFISYMKDQKGLNADMILFTNAVSNYGGSVMLCLFACLFLLMRMFVCMRLCLCGGDFFCVRLCVFVLMRS